MKMRIQGNQANRTSVVEVELSPAGSNNTALGFIYLDPVTPTRSFPLTIEGASEKTKKGVRRVMVKATVKVPSTDTYSDVFGVQAQDVSAGARMRDVSCHAVITIPKGVDLSVEGGPVSALVGNAIQTVISACTALLGNKTGLADLDPVAPTAEDKTSPLVRGLNGAWPIDTLSGDYGQAVATP